MPYPEKLLAEDEEVVEHLHPHWLTLIPAVAAFILICVLVGLGVAFLPDSDSHHSAHQALLAVIIVVALVLLGWLTVAPLIRWRSTHYVLTTHRVLIRRGVLKHVGRDIQLGRISDVAYEQTLADRIFRAGTLHIESAGENGQETLVNIPRANDVQQTLNRLIEADSTRRGQYQPGGYRPDPDR
jgi:uncharacterized membrane protein YdbT with pleckstrin-like domain